MAVTSTVTSTAAVPAGEARGAGAPVRPTAGRVDGPFDASSPEYGARSTQEVAHS
jgi:hypothetical protein